MTARQRAFSIVVAVAAAAVWLSIVRIGSSLEDGPLQFEYTVADSVPITLYLPDAAHDEGYPSGRRPPVVVAGHGFTGDRRSLRTISTALAQHGYAVAALDFRGHGANRRPFIGRLDRDVVAVMDFFEHSRWVDASRIALLGHSMGAGAVLDTATRDRRPDAVIPVSGGRLGGDLDPSRVLLVIAEGDPEYIRSNARRLAGLVKGSEVADIKDTNHLSVISDDETIEKSVAWLDETWDIDRGKDAGFPPVLRDAGLRYSGPRAVVALLAAAIVIAGIGFAAGRSVPIVHTSGTPWLGLGLLALALIVAVPIVRVAPVAAFVPLDVFNIIASYLLVAAGLLAWRSWIRSDVKSFVGMRRALGPALAASAAIYVLLAPLLSTAHRFVPTPERAIVFVVASLALLPFFAVVDSLVRRGGLWTAALGCIASRVMVVAAMAIGASRGWLPSVVLLAVPVFAAIFLAVEIFAFAAYAGGRNTALIVLVESIWIAWLVALTLPVTL